MRVCACSVRVRVRVRVRVLVRVRVRVPMRARACACACACARACRLHERACSRACMSVAQAFACERARKEGGTTTEGQSSRHHTIVRSSRRLNCISHDPKDTTYTARGGHTKGRRPERNAVQGAWIASSSYDAGKGERPAVVAGRLPARQPGRGGSAYVAEPMHSILPGPRHPTTRRRAARLVPPGPRSR